MIGYIKYWLEISSDFDVIIRNLYMTWSRQSQFHALFVKKKRRKFGVFFFLASLYFVSSLFYVQSKSVWTDTRKEIKAFYANFENNLLITLTPRILYTITYRGELFPIYSPFCDCSFKVIHKHLYSFNHAHKNHSNIIHQPTHIRSRNLAKREEWKKKKNPMGSWNTGTCTYIIRE